MFAVRRFPDRVVLQEALREMYSGCYMQMICGIFTADLMEISLAKLKSYGCKT